MIGEREKRRERRELCLWRRGERKGERSEERGVRRQFTVE